MKKSYRQIYEEALGGQIIQNYVIHHNLYISKDKMIEFYDIMSECQYWLEYRNLLINKRSVANG